MRMLPKIRAKSFSLFNPQFNTESYLEWMLSEISLNFPNREGGNDSYPSLADAIDLGRKGTEKERNAVINSVSGDIAKAFIPESLSLPLDSNPLLLQDGLSLPCSCSQQPGAWCGEDLAAIKMLPAQHDPPQWPAMMPYLLCTFFILRRLRIILYYQR